MSKKSIRWILIAEIIMFAFLFGRLTVMITDDRPPAAGVRVFSANTDVEEASDIAKRYLSTSAYSSEGLVNALITYEHFEESAAKEAVQSLSVNWQEQAVKEADAYLNMDGVSEKRLREYMERDLFTEKEIDEAIGTLSPDWGKQAERRVEVMKDAGVDTINLRATLIDLGFSKEEAASAAGDE